MEAAIDQVLCPHCGIMVAKKTYRMHKRIYFDTDNDQWVKKKPLAAGHCSEYYY